ncbi:hypothetical protein [Gemmata massiliana]|uniref:hypothetical protein n=1 Tax=Gemmata massiliana TaxID=1210884 RepID=UPI0013A6F3A2|nr:hypothetical protein [Gemmata massiliana]
MPGIPNLTVLGLRSTASATAVLLHLAVHTHLPVPGDERRASGVPASAVTYPT